MPLPDPIVIYTDGACLGNPGPGGWAAIMQYQDKTREISGSEKLTTNNRMEMTAIIQALTHIRNNKHPIHLHTDSKYVMQGMEEWLPNWRKNGFRTASKKTVKNKELWLSLENCSQQLKIKWFWVRGHDGCTGNERADELAKAAARQAQTA